MAAKLCPVACLAALILVIGCAAPVPTPLPLPASGSPLTPEWLEYNTRAEAKGAPILVYAVTAKELLRTKPREPSQITDTFSLDNEEVYVFTKWRAVKGRPIYHAKIYDPRGLVFHQSEIEYQFALGDWNIWTTLHVKGWPAARLPGRWRAEIFMDGSLALTKEFMIGSEMRSYEPRLVSADAPGIGVHPYFKDAETSYRDNSTLLPLYIAQMLMVDFPRYRIVTPFELRKDLPRPVAKLDDYGSLVKQEIQSPASYWNRIIKKHGLGLLIAGKVYDPAFVGEEKEATLYLIGPKAGGVKEIKASYRSFQRRETVRANLYQEIYDQMTQQGAELFKLR